MADFSFLANHPLFSNLLEWLLSPASRTFFGFWLTSVLIALCWASLRWKKRSVYLKQTTQKSYWWNPSTIQDYQLVMLNQVLFYLIGAGWLIVSITLANQSFILLDRFFSPGSLSDYSAIPLFIGFALLLLLTDDLSRYALHRLLHWGWFWRIHQLHHSATTLTPISFLRVHPIEKLLYQIRSAVVYGICTGIFFFLTQQHPQQWLIFGVLGTTFIFNLLGANLRHSMIPISYGRLEKLFISPLQHQLHHGKTTSRKNYGSMLAIWDRMFNSWLPGKTPAELPDKEFPLHQQLLLKKNSYD